MARTEVIQDTMATAGEDSGSTSGGVSPARRRPEWVTEEEVKENDEGDEGLGRLCTRISPEPTHQSLGREAEDMALAPCSLRRADA